MDASSGDACGGQGVDGGGGHAGGAADVGFVAVQAGDGALQVAGVEGVVAELVAGADLNPRMRASFAERYPTAKVYESVAEMCKDPKIDAVWTQDDDTTLRATRKRLFSMFGHDRLLRSLTFRTVLPTSRKRVGIVVIVALSK